MKIIKHPIFILFILMALFVYLADFVGFNLPFWVDYYLNDFLCMPIVLSVSLAITRYIKSDYNLYVPLPIIVLITIYFSVHFEWLMPTIDVRYTSDFADIVLYFLGAFLFYGFQKKLF